MCEGCGSVFLTEKECELLSMFAEYSFLAVGQSEKSGYPAVLTDGEYDGNALLLLKLNGLVEIDYDIPLKGFDYGPYRGYSRFGSAALTAKGQDVLETMEINGAQ